MLLGLLFIGGGILIAVYPPLLSLIVATFLIFTGIFLLYLRHYYRKLEKKFEHPLIDFFIRF
jgi:hypothetical protein